MKKSVYPFRIIAVHTRHGTAYQPKGIGVEPQFGPTAASVDAFLDHARPDVAIEITTLNPESGEPAISHIRSAFSRNIHVITANKGPIAYAYGPLCDEAKRGGVEFRFESTVMDGAPVFNTVRNNLPGLTIQGFTGVLNSTSKVVVQTVQRGGTFEDGVRTAQEMGIAEADASFDLDGWDSAAKTAALANVLMNAGTTPQVVERRSLRDFSPEQLRTLASQQKTVMLVSRATRIEDGSLRLQSVPEVIETTDLLATAHGTSNFLLLHTDLMGTVGTVLIEPRVEQTAYGVFLDLVDIARTV